MQPVVFILMGSRADLPHAKAIGAALDRLGLSYEMRIASAHKTPQYLLGILHACEADSRPKVYITIAGRSNALSGFTDAQVTAPVIACPPMSDTFGGGDIYSSLRMPGGVAPGVVLEPSGAALMAAKILGLADPAIKERIQALQQENMQTILADDANLVQELSGS